MSADEVPAVGIPPTRWMTMHQEHETVAHKRSDGDRSLGDHGGTLGANARSCRIARSGRVHGGVPLTRAPSATRRKSIEDEPVTGGDSCPWKTWAQRFPRLPATCTCPEHP